MGVKDEEKRYREIVTQRRRDDLEPFVKVFNITQDGRIQVPGIDHPEFKYRNNPGVILQGDPRPGEEGRPEDGELIPKPEGQGQGQGQGEGDGEEGDEGDPGDDTGSHGMVDLTLDELEAILEDEYDLEFDPGGEETSITKEEGEMKDKADTGTYRVLKDMYLGALEKEIALGFDEEYVEEALRVDGFDADDVFEWARDNNITVSRPKVQQMFEKLENRFDEDELIKWYSIEEMKDNVDEKPINQRIRDTQIDRFYEDDEEYLVPEVEESEDEESSAVVFNYRDVSGSVKERERELITRLFAPMDEYLRAKYDNVRFVYVAHEKKAWEMERTGFYQIKSGGGTAVSSALELIEAMVEGDFDEFLDKNGETVQVKNNTYDRVIDENHSDVWTEGYGEEWDKYYFGAGDGENRQGDMEDMIELIQELPGKKHLHAEVSNSSNRKMKNFREEVEDYDHIVAPDPFYSEEDIPEIWRAVFNDD